MKIIELIISNDEDGIEAISLVDRPAIESNFITLAKEYEMNLAEVDLEKKILMGPALIPNKMIYRKDGDQKYQVFFSESTVEKASQMFLQNGNQSNATLQHQTKVNGMSLVESWIITDPKMDKSKSYGFSLPKGTWMVSMKADNQEIWAKAKSGEIKGFSIEGYFADKLSLELLPQINDDELANIVHQILFNESNVKLKSYNDYGDDVRNNAKRGIELNEKNGNKCATQTGKVRAQQIANGENLSINTIKRMYSYLSRAETYYNENDLNACGTISYLLWGGKSALSYSRNKLKELNEINL